MDFQAILHAIPEILTQILAFGIVLWVLNKFAFQSIYKSLEDRQDAISGDLKEAENKRVEMENAQKEYEEKLRNIEHEAREKIQKAIEEGNQLAEEVKNKARADAEKQLEKAKRDIALELDKARAQIRNDVVNLSTAVASKIIRQNLDASTNEKLVDEFLKEAGEKV